MAKYLISALPSLDTLQTNDLFVIARPGVGDFKATQSQVLPASQQLVTATPVLPASSPSVMFSGTNPKTPQGNLRTSQIVTVNKGESAFLVPVWNSAGQNLNGFGHGIILKNKTLMTAWSRNTSESLGDGLGQLLISFSKDYGVSWSNAQSLYTASSGGSFTTLANVYCWQASSGRIFVGFASGNLGTGEVNNYIMYTDDSTGLTGWNTPFIVNDPNFTFRIYAVVQGMELRDGSQAIFGYGLNIGDINTQRTATMLVSPTGANGTWTRRSILNSYSDTGLELIEINAAYRADGVLLFSFRNNLNARNYFKTSNDHGVTISALGAQYTTGAGKPALVTLTNGTIVMMTRSVSKSTNESCLFVCRDGSGMNANSWGTEQDFDPRHYYYLYGGLYEVAPNVIGCNFGAENLSSPNKNDWSYTMFADGGAVFPTGDIVAKDIFGNGLGVNKQTVITLPTPIAPPATISTIGNSATGTQIATAVNALIASLSSGQTSLINQAVNNGTGLQHPNSLPNCLGWWEAWQTPSNINNWTDNFTHADSTTVVADATRTSGQTLTPTQPKGVWGTSSNKLYLSATTGGSGFQPIIIWDFGKPDGSFTVNLDSYTTGSQFILACRIVDSNNMIIAYLDGTVLTIYKVIAGSSTNVTIGGSVSCPISSTNPVVLTISAGNETSVNTAGTITASANVNNSGFIYNAQYTPSGSDATLFANTVTKWGIITAAVNANRFSLAVFNDTLINGDKIGQIVDLSGSTTSIGDLLQPTSSKQMTIQQIPSLFSGKQFLFNSGQALNYNSNSFSSKNPPFSLFWAGLLPIDTSASRTLILLWDGVGTHRAALQVIGSNQLVISVTSGGITLPAFAGYPQGPIILRLEVNGTNSAMYVNGVLQVVFDSGSVTGQTQIILGDGSNINNLWWLHASAFNTILTPTQAREHERLIATTLKIDGWNPR